MANEQRKSISEDPLVLEKRDSSIAIISTNNEPLNRMTLAYVELLEDLITAERAGVHLTMGYPDAMEGISAFLEKRKPVFNQGN